MGQAYGVFHRKQCFIQRTASIKSNLCINKTKKPSRLWLSLQLRTLTSPLIAKGRHLHILDTQPIRFMRRPLNKRVIICLLFFSVGYYY